MRLLAPSDHVVVVGAGLAGWRSCEELRRHGFAGRLTLVGDESHPPYDRPPLSKQVMSGKWSLEHTTLATPERVDHAQVGLELSVAAVHLDVDATTVMLGDGRVVEGTHVVVATGARARRLPWHSDALFEVRTRDDAGRLAARLDQLGAGEVVAIIGAGFIGAEVATAVAARGLVPVVLEAEARPLLHVLGDTVSRWLEDLPAAAGIDLRTRQHVVGVEADPATGADAQVLFADGTRLAARAVVVGVGAQPNVEWLADSGLVIDNGVVVDVHQLCAQRVAAVGDVASFPWPGAGHVRIEHWQVATDHAGALARYWTLGEETPRLIPYFWSDQYGRKIQMLGHPRPDDDVTRVREAGPQQWLGLYSRDGVVTGVVGLSQPRALMLSKPLLEGATSLQDALRASPWT